MLKQIILIDGNRGRSGQLASALAREGAEVVEFDSGQHAVRHLLVNPVSAVLLDYSSPHAPDSPSPAGKEIVAEITNVDAFVPLIVICGPEDMLEHATSAGADLILRRPLTTQRIVESVKLVLGETLRERARRKSGYIFAFR